MPKDRAQEGRPRLQQVGRLLKLHLQRRAGAQWPCVWSQDTDVPSFIRLLLPPAASGPTQAPQLLRILRWPRP